MSTSTGRRVADAVLTLAAVGGVVCILLVVAAGAFHITLIMFKTGSMSPTIPAGSLALVREIPAAEARVGDVLTIARPGELPITHRVTSVSPLGGGLTGVTMRGDANDFDDPAPYAVKTARIVLFSVPGLATAVVAVSHPVVLGSITLSAALLVSWAFWPRAKTAAKPVHGRRRLTGGRRGRRGLHGRPDGRRAPFEGRRRPTSDRRGRRRGAGAAGAAVVVLAIAVAPAAVGPAAPAHAADDHTETVVGRYLTLVSIRDPDESGSLSPGRPVPWQVGVTVRAPEPGTVHIGITAEGELTEPGALDLDVRACPQRWVNGVCAAGETLWLPRQDLAAAVAPVTASLDNPDGAREIGRLESPTSWLMLRVVMPVSLEPGSAANLRLHAWGSGDVVTVADGAAGPGAGSRSGTGLGVISSAGLLAFTGWHGGVPLALAAVALGVGAGLAASSRRKRAGHG